MVKTLSNFIGGTWATESTERALDVTNPATGKLLARVPLSGTSEVDRAVAVARTAFETWRQVPPVQRARFEALMEKARKQGRVARDASREDVLLSALEALVNSKSENDEECTRVHSGSPYQIVVHRCDQCSETRVMAAGEEHHVSEAQAAAIACDARVLAPGHRNRSTIPPAVRRAVLARDGYRCRAPGCTHTRFLEVHHLKPRTAGGGNQPENLITLGSSCHRVAHDGNRTTGIR